MTSTPPRSPAWGCSPPRTPDVGWPRSAPSEWRFAVTDTTGHLMFDGLTRRRPRSIGRGGLRGGVVELHLSAALLAELAAGGVAICGEWAGVVADIAGQYARRERRQQDLNSRLLGAALRRHTQVRDRTCTFIGCRRAVTTAEQDHTYDHDLGGVTVRANLGPVCAHDHGVKHRRGWNVTQPESGTFTWTSPLGGVYRTRCEPLLPLMPDPAPIALGPESDLPAAVDEGPILNRPPPGPPCERPPPPRENDPDEPLSF
ncbi:MAG: HNH endonuclease [Actinomycetota bacterium]|nr:HNH endonuclease [Actinomycetota bacterium]MDQ3276107.1 HNH endonuclease [Actinomycetota bacterium]